MAFTRDGYAPIELIQLGRGILAARTKKGTDPANQWFSFRRMKNPHLQANVHQLGAELGLNMTKLLLPNGLWPHNGRTIIAEEVEWVTDPLTGGLKPVEADGSPLTYDGIVTTSRDYILAAMGADCNAILLACQRECGVIAIGHGGRRPVLCNLVATLVGKSREVGCQPSHLSAVVTCGPGDDYNGIGFNDYDLASFQAGGREDLFTDPRFRRPFTDENKEVIRQITGVRPPYAETFAITELIYADLIAAGVPTHRIAVDWGSSILDPTEPSWRRSDAGTAPDHTLNLTVIKRF